jgi:hypothetical protein
LEYGLKFLDSIRTPATKKTEKLCQDQSIQLLKEQEEKR